MCLGGVGLGGSAAGDLYGGISDVQAIATIHRAIERGINFIDTSPLYRESERRIGLALEQLPAGAREHARAALRLGDESDSRTGTVARRILADVEVLEDQAK